MKEPVNDNLASQFYTIYTKMCQLKSWLKLSNERIETIDSKINNISKKIDKLLEAKQPTP